ncbi:MAG: methyltransferase MtaB domain-containing protein [Clostridia bacterium]|nr:methyltransferase MtaB domain-containing protein [Clostridia bacterium]
MARYRSMAINSLDDFVYARSPKPVTLQNGLTIGGGALYPEINFTLPPMLVNEATMPDAIANYREIIGGITERALALYIPAFVTELEILPPMTFNPKWGIEICKTVKDLLNEFEAKTGVKTAVRLTPVDIREGRELEHMWHGSHWEKILETFEGGAKAGADFLAIESIGGKEVHDDAIMFCDIEKSIFALSILGCRDMNRLWSEIVRIAGENGAIASGDTACGFANTAMVLADRRYIPKVFAAVVRVISAVRSLVAAECGARGPHKDCGYEGVYVKAIAGTPITMEGRTSACAHLSPVGNVAACVADLWSNESVQNIKLLGGMAPTISFEQLVYDCRLMNQATAKGPETALLLRYLLADSDSTLDPQAYVLRPDVVLEISRELIKYDDYYQAAKAAAAVTLDLLRKAVGAGKLIPEQKEHGWLDSLSAQVDGLPDDKEEFIASVIGSCEKLDPKKYDL